MTTGRAPNRKLDAAVREAGGGEQVARTMRAIANEAGPPLRTNRAAVASWVRGGVPNETTVPVIVEALSRLLGRVISAEDIGLETEQAPGQLGLRLGPDPVDMLRRLGTADIERRRVFATAAYSVAAAALPLGVDQATEYQQRAQLGRRVGTHEIDAVRDMTSLFVQIDERHGGQHGRAAVVQYLTSDVVRLCRGRYGTEDQHRAILSAAAELVYLCGWKAYDGGEHGLAQRYYLQALQLTREADLPRQQAFILRVMAHNGMDLRRPEHTLELADAALRLAAGSDPSTMSLYEVTRARALAVAGRRQEATAQIRAAQDTVMRGDDANMPRWAALWGPAAGCVASHSAKTMTQLGDHAAAEGYYAASARRYAGPTRRITALSLSAQGRSQARQGHIEHACGTWSRALDLLDGIRSARAWDAVTGMRRTLAPLLRRGARTAADLDEQARNWQTSHA